ncbi:putative toxin-antitoxin system toxin component, PIN family [Cyclobacterium sp. GBPx2]|uniref:Toxin-antitoxin system toxin component, PIN family n=1 Tax=Cyclobacterium plantarum TaxID=2716263 RepID=A0ABX0HG33_9BACT|nr:putative toxin-antitoxin system toxin component, PIN family [Cyclobacterium plantarum]
MPKIVLDTNIFLVSLSRKSPYHWVFKNFIQGKFQLCVSNEILSEYAEIIERHMGREVADATLQVLFETPYLIKTVIYFKWGILDDPDDNKFSDCGFAVNADYLVTHDKGFGKLKEWKFPRLAVIDAKQFSELLEG